MSFRATKAFLKPGHLMALHYTPWCQWTWRGRRNSRIVYLAAESLCHCTDLIGNHTLDLGFKAEIFHQSFAQRHWVQRLIPPQFLLLLSFLHLPCIVIQNQWPKCQITFIWAPKHDNWNNMIYHVTVHAIPFSYAFLLVLKLNSHLFSVQWFCFHVLNIFSQYAYLFDSISLV